MPFPGRPRASSPRRWLVTSLAVGLGVTVTGACGPPDDFSVDGVVTIDVGHNQASTTAQHEVLEEVAERISEETDGTVELRLFADSQLGQLGDVPDQFTAGSPTIGGVNAPITAEYGVPELAALNIPYVFGEPRDIERFAASDLHDDWQDRLYEQGFVLIAFNWYQGERHIISDNPEGYPTPETMAGDSIRIPAGDNWAAFFGDLPIDAQQMDGTEVYTAIQQGILNGAEGPYEQILGWSLDELGTTVTLTSHNFDIAGFATGTTLWESLTEEERDVVESAFLWGGEEFSERTLAAEDSLRERLEEAGLEFVEADQDAYRAVAEESITDARFPEYSDDVLEEIRSLGDS
ncbi:TRAP transporter substrate-binding protein DctP [Spiractinospora alimapuensis]|uniref:TRAP transporter substrate-binding protein DctP n=1 Tax=Spiractinospora alimapuensis TaxID=2820884 RepID=UPI001F2F4130|nr:TRAP transporter substrate-binding protein DctP [Spiractinospora alimapuensis]QVQ53796.1 TRAP transporter substrate-binding protein DctP [Spiractinospora alimapuensis]